MYYLAVPFVFWVDGQLLDSVGLLEKNSVTYMNYSIFYPTRIHSRPFPRRKIARNLDALDSNPTSEYNTLFTTGLSSRSTDEKTNGIDIGL